MYVIFTKIIFQKEVL